MRRREEEEAFSRPVRRVEAAKATVDGEMDSEMDSDVNSDVYSDVHDDDHSQVESGRKRDREEDDDFYESMVVATRGKEAGEGGAEEVFGDARARGLCWDGKEV